jgi:glycerate kinase
VKVVLAPDKLKGTLSALEAAAALARGFEGCEVVSRPMADGGEGTLDVLVAAARGRGEPVALHRVKVTGPLGEPVEAELALLGERAILESARTSGLALVTRNDPLRASTRGLGELALAAASLGAEELWVALGGSATTDGGTGFARALGARFLDEQGHELEEGGGSLERLARVEVPARSLPRIIALVDVRSPLLGPRGAARAFGPQKGATSEQVEQLDRGLARLAYRTRPDLAARPGAGAAGGLGFGLMVFAGAQIASGAERVADAIRLDEAITGAGLVVTAEGRFDRTTFEGKTVRHVLARARALGVLAAVVAGSAEPEAALRVRELGVKRVVTLLELAGGDLERARRDAANLCELAARSLRK